MTSPSRGAWYEIRVEGHLDQHWSTSFDGLTLSHRDETTVISGRVADQSELHGLLARVRDLGLTLIAVTMLDAGPLATR